MIFRVENAGPLKKAELDLASDFIVLTGPNNAGKTWLAWSVYAVHRATLSLPTATALFRELLASEEHKLDLADRVGSLRAELASEFGVACRAVMRDCFAASGNGFEPLVTVEPADAVAPKAHVLSARGLRWDGQVLSLVDEGGGGAERVSAPESAYGLSASRAAMFILWVSADTDIAGILGATPGGAVTVFPAERIAVNLFARELALSRTELVDELLNKPDGEFDAKELRRRANRYPRPIRDSIRVANDLGNLSKTTTPYTDLADRLESMVLGGAIRVSEYGDLEFAPQGSGSTVPMHVSASVVKSLASLVFYFRHLARAGELLIIDEPELNLHPDNQSRVAQILAMAVRRGFRVLVSTHSDWFLRELNRLVLASQLRPEELADHELSEEMTLTPDRLGVYLLVDGVSSRVPVEGNGFSIATIDAETNRLNAAEQRMYQRLSEG